MVDWHSLVVAEQRLCQARTSPFGAGIGANRWPTGRGCCTEIGPVSGARLDWANLWRQPVMATRRERRDTCADSQHGRLAQSGRGRAETVPSANVSATALGTVQSGPAARTPAHVPRRVDLPAAVRYNGSDSRCPVCIRLYLGLGRLSGGRYVTKNHPVCHRAERPVCLRARPGSNSTAGECPFHGDEHSPTDFSKGGADDSEYFQQCF